MDERAGKWLWRVLIIFAVTAIPACVVAFISEYLGWWRDLKMAPTLVCSCFGALWGVTVGVMQKSLAKTLIGLNGGALLGFGYGNLLIGRHHVIGESDLIIGFIIVMGVLGALMILKGSNPTKSILAGFLAGCLSALIMYAALRLISSFQRIVPHFIMMLLVCIVPWTSGLLLFAWLALDVIPLRILKETQRTPAAATDFAP